MANNINFKVKNGLDVAGQITSTANTGTAPLVVTSNTIVNNLNVQYLNGQLGSYYASITSPSFLGRFIGVPTGNTASRPTANTGYFRYNTDLITFEGYNGTTWGPIGSGSKGGDANTAFVETSTTITSNYTISTGYNAITAGPVSVANSVVVTIPSGSNWVIVGG